MYSRDLSTKHEYANTIPAEKISVQVQVEGWEKGHFKIAGANKTSVNYIYQYNPEYQTKATSAKLNDFNIKQKHYSLVLSDTLIPKHDFLSLNYTGDFHLTYKFSDSKSEQSLPVETKTYDYDLLPELAKTRMFAHYLKKRLEPLGYEISQQKDYYEYSPFRARVDLMVKKGSGLLVMVNDEETMSESEEMRLLHKDDDKTVSTAQLLAGMLASAGNNIYSCGHVINNNIKTIKVYGISSGKSEASSLLEMEIDFSNNTTRIFQSSNQVPLYDSFNYALNMLT